MYCVCLLKYQHNKEIFNVKYVQFNFSYSKEWIILLSPFEKPQNKYLAVNLGLKPAKPNISYD